MPPPGRVSVSQPHPDALLISPTPHAGEFISLTILLSCTGLCWLACIGHRALRAEQAAVGPATPLLAGQKPMAQMR